MRLEKNSLVYPLFLLLLLFIKNQYSKKILNAFRRAEQQKSRQPPATPGDAEKKEIILYWFRVYQSKKNCKKFLRLKYQNK